MVNLPGLNPLDKTMAASKNMTIGAAVIAIVGLMGYASSAVDAWPKVGWTTPNSHQADIEALREEAVGEIKQFRDEWKCDEWDEELREKLREQDRLADQGENDPDLDEDIRRLREKMEKLDCGRFDD